MSSRSRGRAVSEAATSSAKRSWSEERVHPAPKWPNPSRHLARRTDVERVWKLFPMAAHLSLSPNHESLCLRFTRPRMGLVWCI